MFLDTLIFRLAESALNFLVKNFLSQRKHEEEKELRKEVTDAEESRLEGWMERTHCGSPNKRFRHTRQTFHANESKERAKKTMEGNA